MVGAGNIIGSQSPPPPCGWKCSPANAGLSIDSRAQWGRQSWRIGRTPKSCRPARESAQPKPKTMSDENTTMGQPQVGSDAVLAVGSRWAVNYGSSTYKVRVISLFAGRVYWRSECISLEAIDSEKDFLHGARCAMPLPPVPQPWWKRLLKANGDEHPTGRGGR